MNNIIINFINKLNKDDIRKFAINNNLNVTDEEINFVYNFIKNNYHSILDDPSNFNLSLYKDNFSNENYVFLNNLINKYIGFLK